MAEGQRGKLSDEAEQSRNHNDEQPVQTLIFRPSRQNAPQVALVSTTIDRYQGFGITKTKNNVQSARLSPKNVPSNGKSRARKVVVNIPPTPERLVRSTTSISSSKRKRRADYNLWDESQPIQGKSNTRSSLRKRKRNAADELHEGDGSDYEEESTL